MSANWTEPTGHCTSATRYSSFWVGLDGFNSTTVEQTGSEVDCSGGSPVYYSWYEMYPAFPVNFSNTVRPGDKFFGSVTFNGGSSYTLVLQDITQGWKHTVNKSLSGAANSSAEVIAEAPCCTASGGILPLANFGTVNFSNATANGSADRRLRPDADRHGGQQRAAEGPDVLAVRWRQLQRHLAARQLTDHGGPAPAPRGARGRAAPVAQRALVRS